MDFQQLESDYNSGKYLHKIAGVFCLDYIEARADAVISASPEALDAPLVARVGNVPASLSLLGLPL
jgi:hypothetical protein